MLKETKDLRKHICVLKEQGLGECIELLSDCPVVQCRYCAAQANSLRNVCGAILNPEGQLKLVGC